MGKPRANILGKLSPNFVRPIFPSVQTAKPDWEAIMWDFSVDTWLWILRVMQEKQCDDIHVIQAWSSQVEDYFRTVYLVSVDIIVRMAENLKTYGRLFGYWSSNSELS